MTERRYDPVTGHWRTFVSNVRDPARPPAAEPCPLCTTIDRAQRTGGPAAGSRIVVFDDPVPALTGQPPEPTVPSSMLYRVAPAAGAAEIVVYTDRHDSALAGLPVDHITRLVEVWADRYAVLGARAEVGYVSIFENRDPAAGVTADHAHGQIYGYPEIPPLPAHELAAARDYHRTNRTCVYCDVIAQERADEVRIIAQNAYCLAFVPFAARVPYEVHVAAHRHATSLLDLTDPERAALAQVLKTVVSGYDTLFGSSLPYVMSMHQAPTDEDGSLALSHLHIEFTPAHRRRTEPGYLAGSDVGAGAFISNRMPEEMADELRQAAGAATR